MESTARLTMLTRLGFAARGLLYLVIAFLILDAGRAADPSGAISYLAEGSGRLLIGLIAAGLIGYGLWRLADAAFNIERHDADAKGGAERAGAAVSGIIHLFLAWQAITLLDRTSGGGGNDQATSGARQALQLPGGEALLVVTGLLLIAVGIYQLVKAAKASFLDKLEPGIARHDWVKWSGRLGYAARGLIFAIIGSFVASAGLSSDASEAGGMQEAIAWLSSPWDILIAIGLAGFGLFSLVEARYRVIHSVRAGSLPGRHRRAS